MSTELNFPRINTVFISGRLTRDIELRFTSTGKKVVSLPLAVDRSYQNQDGEWINEASFIDVVVWSRYAELCAERLHKGSPVIVEGFIKTRTYTDKDNVNRKNTEIYAQKVHFLEKNTESNQFNQGSDNYKNTNKSTNNDFESNVTEDDIPF